MRSLRRVSMKPLLRVAFWIGLCPVGSPPTYKPTTRCTLLGLLLGAVWLVFAALIFCSEFANFYSRDDSATMKRALIVTANSALFLGFLGLFIGYFRKVEHLHRVFQLCDRLPGNPRWKTIVFIAEMSVMHLPIPAAFFQYWYESRGMPHATAFAALIVVTCMDKFVFLHLVARVGSSFDDINNRLESIQSQAHAERRVKEIAVPQYTPFSATNMLSETICELRQLHLESCELLETLTRSYEVEILACFVVEFILSVLVVYMQALNFYFKTSLLLDVIPSVLVTFVLSTSVLVFATCRGSSAKGNKSSAIIHSLINKGELSNDEIKQLVFFSMQTVHQKISVRPYDLMDLDYSLMRAFTSSAAMYVAILVQFRTSSA